MVSLRFVVGILYSSEGTTFLKPTSSTETSDESLAPVDEHMRVPDPDPTPPGPADALQLLACLMFLCSTISWCVGDHVFLQ